MSDERQMMPPVRPVYAVVASAKGPVPMESWGRELEGRINQLAANGFELQWCNKDGNGFVGVMVALVPINLPQGDPDRPNDEPGPDVTLPEPEVVQ